MSMQESNRSKRVRRAAQAGVLHWRAMNGRTAEGATSTADYPDLETVLRPMPRRVSLSPQISKEQDVFPSYSHLHFESSFFKSLRRLFTWLTVFTSIFLGNSVDWLLRRDTTSRRAVRLRQGLERAGGTFVKLGQQAAMRIDLLPWEYGLELSRMHDRMPPFDTQFALQAIERTTGRPWQEIFSVFDPEPIGSASIACVYQAVLKDGTQVAVKVRRPDIIGIFLADLQVLDWFAAAAEFLTIFRTGFTSNLRAELRETLLEELDFRREARFQDIFRRNAEKAERDFFTSPKVMFDLSGEEVLVQEFVRGVWLWEVINAVENKDPKGRALLRQLNIDPKVVARRILWTAFWSMDEHLFFHADPHPANILVCPDNRLTFIDFGSCGSFNNQQRVSLEQLVLAMDNQDAEGMTLAMLSLMEPLPLVDVSKFTRDAQEEYLRLLNTFNTPAEYTEYWERTSARQWVVLFKTARKYNIPLNMHMLRMIRATLLYDSIVLRLDNHVDRYAEYTHFMKFRAFKIRKRLRKDVRDAAGDSMLLRLEELGTSLGDIMLRTQSILGKPVVRFGSTIGKLFFSATVFTRMAARIILVTLAALFFIALRNLYTAQPQSFQIIFTGIIRSPYYLAFIIGMIILNLRAIIFRLVDRDQIR